MLGVAGKCGQYCSTTPPSASSPPTPLSAHSFITRLMAALMTFLVMSTVIRYDRLYNSRRKPMSASKQLHWARRRAGCSNVNVQYLRTCVFRTVRARWVWRCPRVSFNTKPSRLLLGRTETQLNNSASSLFDVTSRSQRTIIKNLAPLFSSITRHYCGIHSYPPTNDQHNQIKDLNQSKRPRYKYPVHSSIIFCDTVY